MHVDIAPNLENRVPTVFDDEPAAAIYARHGLAPPSLKPTDPEDDPTPISV